MHQPTTPTSDTPINIPLSTTNQQWVNGNSLQNNIPKK